MINLLTIDVFQNIQFPSLIQIQAQIMPSNTLPFSRSYYDCNYHYDYYILQAREVIGIQPIRRRMHGLGMLKHFSDECYEKLAKK